MSRQSPAQPTRGYPPPRGAAPPPPRATRHRSSVIGPPPGIEAGTGYQSPTRESFDIPRHPPPPPPPPPPPQQQRITSSSFATSSRARPDPNVFDPIYEEPPTPPRRASRRRSRSSRARESDQPTMMFYPSTTTVSSMSSDSFVEPPMPFFRTDPLQVRSRGSDSTLPPMEEEDPRRRTVSTVSSGVLGPGTIEVDPDTEYEEESDSDVSSLRSSGEDRLVRNVSMVRRGQATIIRNPSARRSTVPEVYTFLLASLMVQVQSQHTPSSSGGTDRRMITPPDVPPPQPPRSGSRQSLSRDRRAATPPDMPPPQPPRTTSRQSRLSAMSPPPVLIRGASPANRQPRPTSSVYSSHSALPRSPRSPVPGPRSPPPSSPVPQSPRGFGPINPPTLFPRTTPSPRPFLFPRQVPTAVFPRASLSPSGSSSDGSDSSGSVPPRGRTRRPAPPPLNMEAVAEGQNRGSLTSLPDLLDRATRLYDVLSTGRTTSMISREGIPRFGRESTIQEEDPSRRTPPLYKTRLIVVETLGEMLASYPPPTQKRQSKTRGSWPLSNFPLPKRKSARQAAPSPLRQQTLGRGIVSQRTIDTPSPPARGGFWGSLFPKFDRNDRSPTGPLVYNLGDERKRRDNDPPHPRRCCGLRLRTVLLLLLLLIIIVVAATVVPILLIRRHNNIVATPPSDCQCQNGGAVISSTPQCVCLCPAGFTGSQCQTRDSACVPLSTAGGTPQNTSVGSAIGPLLAVAAANFSSQFTLSAQAIVDQFQKGNISCTSQNSLVNLDGSTSADFVPGEAVVAHEQVVVFEAWTTTTSTTTLTLTFTTTLPFLTSSASSTWTANSTSAGTTTVTSMTASSTFSLATTTVSTTPTASGASSGSLVFGRCVILAVVQDLGVSSAAGVQNLLDKAVEHGETFVHDNTTGLSIDLLAETVSGLPANNGTSKR